jgi:hypothetical protein
MNRQEFQDISKVRRKEAAALLKAKQYAGAYYLLGYSVECALKACIAKQTKKYDFPNKEIAQQAYVHNLEKLLKIAGLDYQLKQDIKQNSRLEVNWSIVTDWKETSRYTTSVTSTEARDLYSACTSRTNGILAWIKEKW